MVPASDIYCISPPLRSNGPKHLRNLQDLKYPMYYSSESIHFTLNLLSVRPQAHSHFLIGLAQPFWYLISTKSRNKVLCSDLTSSLPLFSQGGRASWVTICNQSRTKTLQPNGIGRTKSFVHHAELQVVWPRKEKHPLPNMGKWEHAQREDECLEGIVMLPPGIHQPHWQGENQLPAPTGLHDSGVLCIFLQSISVLEHLLLSPEP